MSRINRHRNVKNQPTLNSPTVFRLLEADIDQLSVPWQAEFTGVLPADWCGSKRPLSVLASIVATVPAMDARERVGRFVLRARKLNEHSLLRDHQELMNQLASGTIQVRVQINMTTGEAQHKVQIELPIEEQFESFAARVRPFTMRKEPVYWEVVLDALESLLSAETLAEVVDIQGLRDQWSNVLQGTQVTQAYYMVSQDGKMTDVALAELWLYSDFLHSQPIQSAAGKSFTLNQRYQAAAGVYARIGACVNNTYNVIGGLAEAGLLSLDPDVFTESVLADTSIEMAGRVYSAELGTEPPSGLSDPDPSVWRPVHEDIELPPAPEGESPDDSEE